MERALGEGRHVGDLLAPRGREGGAIGLLPMALGHHLQRSMMMLHRPDQPDAGFDLAVVEHERRRRHLHGGATRSAVHQELAVATVEKGQDGFERHWPVAPLFGDGEQPGLGAGGRMGVDRPAVGDDEAFGRQRLEPDVMDAAVDRALDLGLEQLLEGGEEGALKLDGQGQQAVEEGRDRRQLVLDAARIHQLQAGGRLEALEGAALDPAAHDQDIELAQGGARVGAFQIVLGPEQALAAGLALAARDRAERVEPPGDRAEKSLLRLHVGRDRAEERRLRLVRPVGAAEPLDRGVGLPARLEQIVDAQAPVPRRRARHDSCGRCRRRR